MKKALCMVLALVLLLSGCNYNTAPGGGTEPSDILGSMPTNPTPAPTNPTTEPTAPTTEPTEPSTEPTEPKPLGTARPEGGVWVSPYPNDIFLWGFSEQYPFKMQMNGNDRTMVTVHGVESHEKIYTVPVIGAVDGEYATYVGRYLYYLRDGGVAKEAGGLDFIGQNSVEYYLEDNNYVITIDMELVEICVEFLRRTPDDQFVDISRHYNLVGFTSVRLIIPDHQSILSGAADVQCYAITEDGEIEITPTEVPDRYPFPFRVDDD